MALFHEPPCVARPSRLPSSTMDSGDGLLAITLRISPAGRGRRLRSSLSNASDVGGAAGGASPSRAKPALVTPTSPLSSVITSASKSWRRALLNDPPRALRPQNRPSCVQVNRSGCSCAAAMRNCAAAAGKPASATGVLMGSAGSGRARAGSANSRPFEALRETGKLAEGIGEDRLQPVSLCSKFP